MPETYPYPVLTVLTFWPVAAALILAFVKGEENVRRFTLAAALVEVALAWPLVGFHKIPGFQFVELNLILSDKIDPKLIELLFRIDLLLCFP